MEIKKTTPSIDNSKKPIISKKRIILKIILFITLFTFLSFAVYGGYKIYKYFTIIKSTNISINVGNLISDIVANKYDPLKKDENGITNLLIVGIDERQGMELMNTDTIIIASYNPENDRVSLISIPRDTTIKNLKNNKYYRVNSLYSLGEKASKGTGLEYMTPSISNYTGLTIHYAVLINFVAFEKIIDSIGGIDVYIEKNITDYAYPDENYGTQVVKFTAGQNHLNGEMALKYARTRHASSDYDRAKRQQQVIDAITAKIKSDVNLQTLSTLDSIVNSLGNNIRFYQVSGNDLYSAYYTIQDNGYPTTDGVVLDPSIGHWKILKEGAADIVVSSKFAITPIPDYSDYSDVRAYVNTFIFKESLIKEDPTIRIYNGDLGYSVVNKEYVSFVDTYRFTNTIFTGNSSLTGNTDIVIIAGEEFQGSKKVIEEYFISKGYKINSSCIGCDTLTLPKGTDVAIIMFKQSIE